MISGPVVAIVDKLTGGGLSHWAGQANVDTGPIHDQAQMLRQVHGELSRQSHYVRTSFCDNLGKHWDGHAGAATTQTYDKLGHCLGGSGDMLGDLGDKMDVFGDTIKRAQQEIKRIVDKFADKIMSLFGSFFGALILMFVCFLVVKLVSKIVSAISHKLSGDGEQLRSVQAQQAGAIAATAQSALGGGAVPALGTADAPLPRTFGDGEQALHPNVFGPGANDMWVARNPGGTGPAEGAGGAAAGPAGPAGGDEVVIRATKEGIELHMPKGGEDVKVTANIGGTEVSVNYDVQEKAA